MPLTPIMNDTRRILKMNARSAMLLMASAAVAAAGQAAAQAPAAATQAAQAWPAKPVRVIVAQAAGSGIDVLARMLAQRLSVQWAGPVVVDNRPGANSVVGTELVARSSPDGHTLLCASDVTFTINPHLYAKLPFDPVADFAPITQLVTLSQLLVAHSSVQANSVAELIALARTQPGAITYSSWGAGSPAHLLMETLKSKAGMDMLHVPYKGIVQAVTAVVTGETMLSWAGVNATQNHIRGGKLKALSVTAPRRSPLMPDVPTVAELGYPELEYMVWFGLLAPAGIPQPLIDRIHRDVARILLDPEVRKKELLSRGYEPSAIDPDQFAALIRRESAQRQVMVKISGAKAD